ncbi:MAG: histidine kinase dimerization/phospho-acceptor domain-containing protein, partial [Bauldia sp.]
MAATNSGYPVDAWMANVIRSRWVAVAGAALVGLLAATGSIPPGVGIVILILLVLLAALGAVLPRDNADRRPAGPQSLPLAAASLEPELGLVAEALPDPCFILDRRGVVRHANRWAMASFAIHPGDTLTARLRVPALVAAFDRVARGGPPERVEFVERVPTERWFAAWFAHLAEPGELILLVLDDMSERRRSERVRADFVANASHELRTPLASLAGFIETLQGPAREDPEARDRFLSIMHEQAERMRRLIDDLLSLSRVEMKAHVRPAEPVDVSAAIRHVADSLAPLARELDVTIETRLPAEPAVGGG